MAGRVLSCIMVGTRVSETLDSSESTSTNVVASASPGMLITIEPGEGRGSASSNPPIQSYDLQIESKFDTDNSFTEVSGSPVSYSNTDKQVLTLLETKDEVKITVTNTGSSTGTFTLNVATESAELILENIGEGRLVGLRANEIQFDDNQKVVFGEDEDFAIDYDTSNDRLEFRDEVNDTQAFVPRNSSGDVLTSGGGGGVVTTLETSDDTGNSAITASGGSTPAFDGLLGVAVEENTYLDVGLAPQDPAFNADYDFNFDWSREWDDTAQEMDVNVTVNWDTDPGGGNDVDLDWKVVQF